MLRSTLDFLFRMVPGILAALILFLGLRPLRKRRLAALGLVSPAPREVVLALFWMFCGGMALLTLTPRWFDLLSILADRPDSLPAFFTWGSVNLTPLRTFGLDFWTLYILLGNIVMFLPIGFFAALLWRGATWKRMLLLGFLTSLFIECWQLLIGRSFDVDDLLLNTLGVLLGALLCQALRRLFPGLSTFFQVH